MSDQLPSSTGDLPQAQIREGRGPSLIWIIPLVALLIGAWLVFKAISEKGPDLTISFQNAEGIEVGKTRIKYKDVEVGKVTDIQLSDDLTHVEISARLSRSAGKHLSSDTRFWIVRPRISTNGVSGLTTLISGVYIGMDPGSTRDDAKELYRGLEQAPYQRTATDGTTFTLSAESLASLDIGSPVYYRHIKVGELVKYQLTPGGRSVELDIFIDAPYDKLVKKNSRFWNASGFDLRLTSEGVSAQLESLAALMSGGISFETPKNLETSSPAASTDRFVLYPDYASTSERQYNFTLYYVMDFKGSLRGLNKGAPVEYRGIKVGEVKDISIEMDRDTYTLRVPVLVALYPERIATVGTLQHPQEALESLVKRGLRAQVKPGSLLTGQMYIDLALHEGIPETTILAGNPYKVFPTIEADLDTITRSVTELFSKVEKMPLLEITQELHSTMRAVSKLTNSPDTTEALANLNAALREIKTLTGTTNKHAEGLFRQIAGNLSELNAALTSVQGTLSEDSILHNEVSELIRELSAASRSMKDFTDYLQRNPDALIFGKDNLDR
ncbi:MAG: PqiB family protein [bacterium]